MYSTVAGFDTLMSNFYKITQDKSNKILVFVKKLERVLNQIRSRFPAKLGEKKVEGLIRDHLFHGMKKTLRDFPLSIC